MKLQRRHHLSIQMQGDDVGLLHQELQLLGYIIRRSEQQKQKFGEDTQKAVQDFQRKRGLEPTGEVNLQTARHISRAAIRNADDDKPPDYIVDGKVFFLYEGKESPLPGVKVQAFDLDLRREEPLGEGPVVTNDDGYYKIHYTANQFARAEKRSADLVIRVFSPEEALLTESQVIFNASAEETVDLIVKPLDKPPVSEYEQLRADLAPVLQDVPLVDLNDREVDFLVKETGSNPEHVKILVRAAELSAEADLLIEALYGLGRRDVLPLNLDTLLNLDPDDLVDQLKAAIGANIIPATVAESIDDILRRLQQLREERWWQETVLQQLVGQLIDDKNETPLVGFTVRATDLDAEMESHRDLGYDITDSQGHFTVVYRIPRKDEQDEDGTRRLQLRIFPLGKQESIETIISADPNQEEIKKILVSLPPLEEPPSPTLEELNAAIELELPESLQAALAERKIQTLADLRRAWPALSADVADLMREQEDVEQVQQAMQSLGAFVNFSVLPDGNRASTSLIKHNFTSTGEMAHTPRPAFVTAIYEDVGDFKSAQTQAVATVQQAYLNNLTADLVTRLANGTLELVDDPLTEELPPAPCGCQDCEAAVSPAAYLADLLKYAKNHLRNDGRAISLQFLTDTFHQRFGELPTSCDAVDQEVRQVRLCIEVLRHYLGANVGAAEQAYRETAYTTLLTRFGTSFADLCLARTAEDDVRKSLTDRLGIDLGSARPDHLDALILDPDAPANQPKAITEPMLERLFGLIDTQRDPLSEGTKYDDPDNQITRWNFEGVQWKHNINVNGTIFLSLTYPFSRGNREYRIWVYRDGDRAGADLVASGRSQEPAGPVDLIEENDSGLSGRVEINYTNGSDTIKITIIPNLLSWRLEHLRTLWWEQDWPTDSYMEEFDPPEARLPIIDPDVIGVDDFRLPFLKADQANPDRAFDLWDRRRHWVDARLKGLAAFKKAGGTPDLDGMLSSMGQQINYEQVDVIPWEIATQLGQTYLDALEIRLDALSEALLAGHDSEATIHAIRRDLNLTEDSFTRLIALREKDRLADLDDRNERVSLAEWREVRSILVQAQKTKFYTVWRDEEQQISFGPKEFWPALRKPTEGDWPPAILIEQPLIDPELLTAEELTEVQPGQAALRLWQAHQATLERIQHEIEAEHEANDFNAMLRRALGHPTPGDPLPHDIADLENNLDSGNPADRSNAETAIQEDLFLTLEAFKTLLDLRDREAAPAPADRPSASEWNALYAILTTARKRKQEYPSWVTEESQLPLVDPEVSKIEDLPSGMAGQRARYLWNERQTVLEQVAADLQAERENHNFDAMLRQALGEPDPGDALPHDLNDLDVDLRGADPVKRINARERITRELYLTEEAFNRLLAIKAKYDSPDTRQWPAASEWAELYQILTSAQKEKRLYAAWRQAEEDPISGIVYWSAFKARRPRWLAPAATRQQWVEALQRRSQTPLIDPDLIGPGHLRDPFSGPVAERWQFRQEWIQTQLDDLVGRTPGTTDLEHFDNICVQSLSGSEAMSLIQAKWRTAREAKDLEYVLKQLFGDPLPDLDALADNLTNGTEISATRQTITESLYLTLADFDTLMQIRADDAAGRPVNVAQWDELYLILARSTWVANLMSLHEIQQNGEEITPRLAQLGLTMRAFARLVRIRRLAARDEAVQPPEWEDVYAILVQIQKQHQFALWRREERERQIVLSPDHFTIPERPPLQFPPVEPKPLLAWRASRSQQRDWQDALQARIEQETAVIKAYGEAVSATEEDVLPLLRSTLIGTTKPQIAIERDKARWITNHLLIDAETDVCQKTTRISQAIETIQGLLWSIRTAQLNDTYPKLELDDDHFDERWTWIGSYATWRAAMFVFMYPENILLPSLRRWQTPGFRQLVKEVRANRLLSPEGACEAARRYSDYYRDVCHLTVTASCQAPTVIHSGDCRDRTDRNERSLFYMFARGGETQTLYWSVYDPEQAELDPDYAQTFWQAVPGLEPSVEAIGAVPYALKNGERHIFLFVHNKAEQKLLLLRYSLDNQHWHTTLTELNLPEAGRHGHTIVVKQRSDMNEPPHLAVQVDGRILGNQLNRSGDDWIEDEWELLFDKKWFDNFGSDILVGMIGTTYGGFFLLRYVNLSSLYYRYYGVPGDPFWRKIGGGAWVGGFRWPNDEKIYIFQRNGVFSKYTRIYTMGNNQALDISPGTNNSGDWPTEISVDRFADWIERAAGILLHRITMSDVLQDERWERNISLGAFLGYKPVATLETYTPGVPKWWVAVTLRNLSIEEGLPEIGGMTLIWFLLLQEVFDWVEKQVEEDEQWGFIDDYLNNIRPYNLRQLFERITNQQPVDLPSPEYPYEANFKQFGGSVSLEQIATHCWTEFPMQPSETMLIAYEKNSTTQTRNFRSILVQDTTSDELNPTVEELVSPLVTGPFDIVEQLSEAALQNRRREIEAGFQANEASPRSNRVYLEEAYYFVPVHLALQLQQRGHYVAALDWFRTVYDYSMPLDQRKIYYGLVQEDNPLVTYQQVKDWLLDPLNPHAIAETRANTYTRFTLLSLVRCLLEYADAEFTRDTAESVPRARTLYLTALELLDTEWLKQRLDTCDDIIGTLDIDVPDPQWTPIADRCRRDLSQIGRVSTLRRTIAEVEQVLRGDEAFPIRLQQAYATVATVVGSQPSPPRQAEVVTETSPWLAQIHNTLLANDTIYQTTANIGSAAARDYLQAVSFASGVPQNELELEQPSLPWLRTSATRGRTDNHVGADRNPESFRSETNNARLLMGVNGSVPSFAESAAPMDLVLVSTNIPGIFVPSPPLQFCIPPNPVLVGLRLRAELNLYKLRTCRNIAGVERQIDPYAAATDTVSGLPQIGAGGQILLPGVTNLRPTGYRYKTLIERAKTLVQLAAQIEGAMLAALEKRDAEYYNLLKAQQDVRLTAAGVKLQRLRVKEAQGSVELAEIQEERSQLQVDHWDELLAEPISALERQALSMLKTSADLQIAAAVSSFGAGLSYFAAADVAFLNFERAASNFGSALSAIGSGLSTLAAQYSTRASILSNLASYERRQKDWEFQKELAVLDGRISTQQKSIAEDHVRVVGQEHKIAEMQADHARDTMEFLANKFTNAELYDWMSDILEQVYGFFLQQAAAMAKLAEHQLGFERQEVPPALIQADYWEAPSDLPLGLAGSGNAPDRRGLTGSARLLQDIHQLDQYAFETEERKLQLTKTISLVSLAPAEFQRFRETGVMTFATPMELFDRDFPGHYLRLIKRVRTSVIALIPPIGGIRATITTTGISRVVIGGDLFQPMIVRRDPETIALSSPREATGLFELEPQSEMLLPFEGMGVDTVWEFRLPKPANPFDFNTIADVLVTIEYTALNSFDYRQQVIQELDDTISADRPFSFRHQFADQWYDLHNAEQSATPMTVRFTTRQDDFPPNLENLHIQELILYFARKAGSTFEVNIDRLCFTDQDGAGPIGGEASSKDGVISTLTGGVGSWASIRGKTPFGEWELALRQDMQSQFENEEIEDILFVITYGGRTPEWPL